MKLAFISPSFYPAFYYGGPIFSTYYNALGLSNLGIKVYVSTADSNGPEKLNVETNSFIKQSDNFFIKYYSPSSARGFSFKMITGLWKDIKAADVVYTQSLFSSSSIFVLWYSAILKKSLLLSPRGQLGSWSIKSGSRFKKLWLSVFIKPFAKTVHWHVTAEAEKHDVLAVFPGAAVHVIPNGIDLKKFNELSAVKTGTYYSKFSGGKVFSKNIISMGRLHKVKGFDILIEAFAGLLKDFPDTGLFIAGEDYGEKDILVEKVNVLGLNGNVFFTGQINDEQEKIKFLSNADVFALASHNENFGIVYAEALAAGTPIVASKGTPWEIVEVYHCGKWVENNEHSFIDAIKDLFSADLLNMRENGLKLIKENFSWDAVSQKFREVLEELYKGNS